MTAIVAFAVLILVIRGVPALFNYVVRLLRQKRLRRPLKALPPPSDSNRPWS